MLSNTIQQSIKTESSLGAFQSLQVSNLGNVPTGDFMLPHYGLLKNITEDNVTATVVMMSGDLVQTVLYPGWNPEIVKGVINLSTANTLQYGY